MARVRLRCFPTCLEYGNGVTFWLSPPGGLIGPPFMCHASILRRTWIAPNVTSLMARQASRASLLHLSFCKFGSVPGPPRGSCRNTPIPPHRAFRGSCNAKSSCRSLGHLEMLPFVLRPRHKFLESLIVSNAFEEGIALDERVVDEAAMDRVLQPIERFPFGTEEG
jgi:hypothetical protein